MMNRKSYILIGSSLVLFVSIPLLPISTALQSALAIMAIVHFIAGLLFLLPEKDDGTEGDEEGEEESPDPTVIPNPIAELSEQLAELSEQLAELSEQIGDLSRGVETLERQLACGAPSVRHPNHLSGSTVSEHRDGCCGEGYSPGPLHSGYGSIGPAYSSGTLLPPPPTDKTCLCRKPTGSCSCSFRGP